MASSHFVPKLNLPSARSDWGDPSFSSRGHHSERTRMNPMGMPSVPEASSYRNPWPGLEERFWQPPADNDERGLGGLNDERGLGGLTARVGAIFTQRMSEADAFESARSVPMHRASPPAARPPVLTQKYPEPNPRGSKAYAANTESSSWWFSSSASAPSLNCSASAVPPKERHCEGLKDSTRHCSAKGIDRQCNHLTQDCEDNIKELLFRDAAEEVEERPLKPADAFAECQPRADRPDTLKNTLKTWSVPGR